MSNVPKVRFKGFTDEWEDRKLGELANFFDNQRIPIESDYRVSGIYPYYGATGVIDYINDYIFDGNYVLLAEDGANIVTRNSPIAYYTKGQFWLNNHAHIMQMKEGDNYFLLQSLESKNFEKYNSGTAQPKLNSQVVKNIYLNIPNSLDEQNKLGDLFQIIDDYIDSQYAMLQLKKKFKKAMPQKMFPQKGETVPKLRFDGFDDDWEERKLGDIVEFFSGLTYSPNNLVSKPGTFVLRSSNVKDGKLVTIDNVYVDSKVANSSNVQIGDIIVVVRNGSRDLIGKHAQIKSPMKDTVIGAFMTGIRSTEANFINALLDTRQFKIEINKNLGATINQITTGVFKKMIFSVTSNIAEQQKIGAFFTSLDDQIAELEQQLEHTKQMKKALLQKMFV